MACRPPPVDYLARTREWPVNLLFLAPFAVIGELCLLATRCPVENAAGRWFRTVGESLGSRGLSLIGLLVAALLLAVVGLRAKQAARDRGVFGGMLAEGLLYGAVLGVVAQTVANQLPLGRMVPLALPGLSRSVENLGLALGAGVFEELLFRAVLLGGIWSLLRHLLGADRLTAGLVAVGVAAWVFAAWHHWGPGAEPWDDAVVRFRFAAGAVLGGIFLSRGLGIAALAHGFYDVLVLFDGK
jgi:membrane protease YdiL (CAAX protease family)